MKISGAYPSKYLKAADLGDRSLTVTIDKVAMENVGQEGGAEEFKPVLYFQGKQKGLVLNKTNAEAIAYVYGDETDVWSGKAVEIFTMMVSYQGRMTPGIRIRAQQGQWIPDAEHQAPPNQPIQPPVVGSQAGAELDDDIPF